MDYFGDILRKSRTSAKLTQKELAENVDIDTSSVSKMEKGVFLPVRKVAVGLADTLGMSDRPITLYVSNKDKAALERFIFFLTAYVAGIEDVQEIRLVEVEDDKLGQAITQGSPAQQLPFMAGVESPELQQIFTSLQQLTAQVAHLTAEVAELKQQKGATASDVFQGDQQVVEVDRPSVAQSHRETSTIVVPHKGIEKDTTVNIRKTLRQAEMRFSRIIMNWTKKDKKRRDLDEAIKYEEEWTKKIEEEGSLFIVMMGFQGMTVPEAYYDEMVKPILERKGEEAEKIADFMRQARECLERRRVAFDRQVRNPENLFRHITPLRALDSYKYTGFHRPDEWTRIYKGNPATWEQQVRHIRRIIDLLEYPNYQLGFLTGEIANDNLYKNFVWEIKGGHILNDTFIPHTVFLEDLEEGEQDFIIRDTEIVCNCYQYSESLWKSEAVIKDKKKVKKLLDEHIT